MTKSFYIAVLIIGVAFYTALGCFTVTNMLELVR